MGNDDLCKVLGIWNIKIKIKIFNGVVRTLCNVINIPDLRKNLISLVTLDRNGFNFKFKNRVLKLSKCVITVIKGHKLLGDIFRLLCTVVIDGVPVRGSKAPHSCGYMHIFTLNLVFFLACNIHQ
jgi:hypothetical protein